MPPNNAEIAVFEHHVSVAPLPSPDDLERYEQILPGTANRLITMMEAEQAARLQEEQAASAARAAAEKRGQRFGLAIAITGIIVAGVAAVQGALVPAVAVAVCSTSGGGLFTWLLRGRQR